MKTKKIKIYLKKITSLFTRETLELDGFYHFEVKGRKMKLHKGIAKKSYLSGYSLRVGKLLFEGKAQLTNKMKPTSGFIQFHKGNIIPASKIKGKLTKKIKVALYGLLSDKKVTKKEHVI